MSAIVAPRQLHVNVDILHSGFVPSAWRLPGADPKAFIDIAHYVNIARIAEAGKFDAVFLADNASIADQINFRPITALEPTLLLTAMGAATTHIGWRLPAPLARGAALAKQSAMRGKLCVTLGPIRARP